MSWKVLFSGKNIGPDSSVDKNALRLSRTEIVALFNGFARLSNSIVEIENFRELLAKESSNNNGFQNKSIREDRKQADKTKEDLWNVLFIF